MILPFDSASFLRLAYDRLKCEIVVNYSLAWVDREWSGCEFEITFERPDHSTGRLPKTSGRTYSRKLPPFGETAMPRLPREPETLELGINFHPIRL
jgi:hypothetical protein